MNDSLPEYVVMLYGLANATFFFQSFTNKVHCYMINRFVIVYENRLPESNQTQ